MSREISSHLSEQTFESEDHRYRVTIPVGCIQKMLADAVAAGANETGGIIVGRYNDALDHAVVTAVLGPPSDSNAWATGFLRGVHGLVTALRGLWSSPVSTYYLGEWHYHPFAAAAASPDDARQMFTIAQDDRYRCPEPVLLVLGGDPAFAWELAATVFTRAGARFTLFRSDGAT